MYDYDADNFNFMLQDKDEVKVPDDSKVLDDAGKLIISGLKNILTDKKKNEEEEDDNKIINDPNKPKPPIDNNPVKTIDLLKIK